MKLVFLVWELLLGVWIYEPETKGNKMKFFAPLFVLAALGACSTESSNQSNTAATDPARDNFRCQNFAYQKIILDVGDGEKSAKFQEGNGEIFDFQLEETSFNVFTDIEKKYIAFELDYIDSIITFRDSGRNMASWDMEKDCNK